MVRCSECKYWKREEFRDCKKIKIVNSAIIGIGTKEKINKDRIVIGCDSGISISVGSDFGCVLGEKK